MTYLTAAVRGLAWVLLLFGAANARNVIGAIVFWRFSGQLSSVVVAIILFFYVLPVVILSLVKPKAALPDLSSTTRKSPTMRSMFVVLFVVALIGDMFPYVGMILSEAALMPLSFFIHPPSAGSPGTPSELAVPPPGQSGM